MPLTLVILAAGIGSRYGGLKQIDPVGPSGEIVIDYSIYDAFHAGFDRLVFVIRRQIEKDFKAAIGSRFEQRVPVEYVYQELDDLPDGFTVPVGRQKPWGTGHAVLTCRNVVKGPFGVINADDFYGRKSFGELARFLKNTDVNSSRYCMVGFVLRNTLSEHGHVARGICDVERNGLLKSVVERTRIEKEGVAARFTTGDGQWHSLTGDELASMNFWGFTPTLFRHLQREFPRFLSTSAVNPKAEFFIPTVVDNLIKEEMATVSVLKTPDKWVGVTYQEDKPVVIASIRELVAAGVYPRRLWT